MSSNIITPYFINFKNEFPNHMIEEKAKSTFQSLITPVLCILRIWGLYPLTISYPYRLSIFWIFYSIFIYASIIILSWFWSELAWLQRLKGNPTKDKDYTGFEGILLDFLLTMNYIPLLVNPWIVWPEMNNLAKFFDKSKDFQVMFHSNFYQAIHFRFQSYHVIIIWLVIFILNIIYYIFYSFQFPKYSPVPLIMCYLFLDMMRYNMFFLWFILHECLTQYAQNFINQIKKNFLLMDSNIARIPSNHHLWFYLSDLARCLGRNVTYSYQFYLLLLFIMTTLSLYQVLRLIIYDQTYDDFVFMFIELNAMPACILIYCLSAERTTRQVGRNFQRLLINDLNKKNYNNSVEQSLKNLIVLTQVYFPEINLSHYLVVNRELIIGLSSTLFTYIIVIMQFKITTSEDENKELNRTLDTF